MLQVHQGLYINSPGVSEYTATLGMKGSFQGVVPLEVSCLPFGLRSPISPGKIHENARFFLFMNQLKRSTRKCRIKVTGWRAKLLIVEHGRLLHCPNYRRMLQPACGTFSDHSTGKETLQ